MEEQQTKSQEELEQDFRENFDKKSPKEKEEVFEQYVANITSVGPTAYNYFKFLRLYPQTMKDLEEYIKIKAAGLDVTEDLIMSILLYNSQIIIFGFLDDIKNVYVNVLGKAKEWFFMEYYDESGIIESKINYDTRKEAEMKAVEKAFEHCENKK